MRIARFSNGVTTRFGLVGDDLNHLEVLSGDPLFDGVKETGEIVSLADVRLLAPVANPSKIIGIGKNYLDHIKEFDSSVPVEPLIFLKPTTALIGTDEPIVLPNWSEHVDHEAEMAVVIKTKCKDLALDDVDDAIFGFTVGNDVSARDIQRRDKQWTRAKGFDTACPLGPWIETTLGSDVQNLQITATVNGVVKQHESTALMIHPVRELVAFVSTAFTLLPGDVILTGTPAGVSRIDDGDQVEITISRIGTLSNPVIRA